jgi:hypothetical protein
MKKIRQLPGNIKISANKKIAANEEIRGIAIFSKITNQHELNLLFLQKIFPNVYQNLQLNQL